MLVLKVIPKDGEPWVVETNLATVIAWERKYKRPASDFAKQMAMEWVCFMAYEASRTSGFSVPMIFDDFIKKIHNVEVVDTETDPTDPVPTDGSL